MSISGSRKRETTRSEDPVYGHAGFRGGVPEAAGGGRARDLRRIHPAGPPQNRGHKLAFSPVKEYALAQGSPCISPENAGRHGPGPGAGAASGADRGGGLWPHPAGGHSEHPTLGSINVHSSLLPKYRGAPPSTGPSSTGTRATGVTIMYMAKELDAGDTFLPPRRPSIPTRTP